MTSEKKDAQVEQLRQRVQILEDLLFVLLTDHDRHDPRCDPIEDHRGAIQKLIGLDQSDPGPWRPEDEQWGERKHRLTLQKAGLLSPIEYFQRSYIDRLAPFAAPWKVEVYGHNFLVRAACGRVVVQPDESLDWCEAVAQSRNQSIDQDTWDAISLAERRRYAAAKHARENEAALRETFYQKIHKLEVLYEKLQDTVAHARDEGRIDLLPEWCQRREEPEEPLFKEAAS